MNTATRTAIEVLAPVIREATKEAVSDNTGGRTMGGVDASRVAAAVTQEVTAVVVNQTNAEPWYRSNVTLGLILTALATIIKPWAGDVPFLRDPDTAAAVVTLIQGAGLLWSFAGRWWIKKPLGA